MFVARTVLTRLVNHKSGQHVAAVHLLKVEQKSPRLLALPYTTCKYENENTLEHCVKS